MWSSLISHDYWHARSQSQSLTFVYAVELQCIVYTAGWWLPAELYTFFIFFKALDLKSDVRMLKKLFFKTCYCYARGHFFKDDV